MTRLTSDAQLERLKNDLLARSKDKKIVSLTNGTDGKTRHSQKVLQAFVEQIQKQGLADRVIVKSTGCHGFCEIEPSAIISPQQICYVSLKVEDVTEIVTETLLKGKIVDRLLYQDPHSGKKCTRESDIPFYALQHRLVLANNRFIDMESIDDYIALGGYAALARALYKMTPEQVLEEVKNARLRGRGGGGFPAGRKWQTTRDAPAKTKYVVVNADEGDPGAYMDRSLLEGNPHSILEGLIIGAYAMGAKEGFVYVRQEYPLAVQNLEIALKQAAQYGLLGKNILGSGFDFNVNIHRGAGAFVSGESSALMCAIEGLVGEPRPKYIHTSVKGLWDKPTCLNNVETWANVPLIINKGADWFRKIGTENSKGTKIFSLVGKINHTGLVEVPMGITLRQIVYDIGGGIPKGKKFKAVQTGGPSGGVLPESLLDLPVDFDQLSRAGSMMGSGGMIVMDEDTCMVDTARYYTNFLARESCGKCVPCREGLRHMLKILNNITDGRGRPGDLQLLEELSDFVRQASLCALGTTAPNPVLSTIKHFRSEYQAHIEDKKCPAGVCLELISFYINPDDCIACGLCAKNCPTDAVSKDEEKNVYLIDQEKCVKCGSCLAVCPDKARAVVKRARTPVEEKV
ncbi:MAG: NADH dehydrogenase [Phycisphaerae bacterium SM23_30]|nr:MAG: NADH dehydrogenase [Phycisphaerae bacterium SM23_30]